MLIMFFIVVAKLRCVKGTAGTQSKKKKKKKGKDQIGRNKSKVGKASKPERTFGPSGRSTRVQNQRDVTLEWVPTPLYVPSSALPALLKLKMNVLSIEADLGDLDFEFPGRDDGGVEWGRGGRARGDDEKLRLGVGEVEGDFGGVVGGVEGGGDAAGG